jgi:predicted DNA-binding transcriptional regulator YafY
MQPMRRADRLFQIVQTIRGRRLTTAAHLAQRLEVSERTIYHDAVNQPNERTVRPLGVFYWGTVWTLAAWCELKEDFRSFRVDRIATLDVLEHRFVDEDGKTLADLLRSLPC